MRKPKEIPTDPIEITKNELLQVRYQRLRLEGKALALEWMMRELQKDLERNPNA